MVKVLFLHEVKSRIAQKLPVVDSVVVVAGSVVAVMRVLGGMKNVIN